MGLAYYIVLEDHDANVDSFVNGKFIARNYRAIERASQKDGLASFQSYISYSKEEIEDMMEEAGFDEPPKWWSEEKWFSPEEGISWVNGLIRNVKNNLQDYEEIHEIQTELNEYLDLLNNALKIRTRWHLSLDH